MKKRDGRFISFTTALTLILAMIPVFNVSVSADDLFQINSDLNWTHVGDNNPTITYSDNSITVRGNDNGNGLIYVKLPDDMPTTGTIDVDFSYKITPGSDADCSFAIMGDDVPTEVREPDIAGNGFGVSYEYSSTEPKNRVITDGNHNFDKEYITAKNYTIDASLEYADNGLTVKCKVTDEQGQNVLTRANDKYDTPFTPEYIAFYLEKNAQITVSDFSISTDSDTAPTEQPTPTETESPSSPTVSPSSPVEEIDPNIIYDLDSDTRDLKGWNGGNLQYENGYLKITNTEQGDRSQTVQFETPASTTYPVDINMDITMQTDKDGKAGSSSGLYSYFRIQDDNGNSILELKAGNSGSGKIGSALYINGNKTNITSDNGIISFNLKGFVDTVRSIIYVMVLVDGKVQYINVFPYTGGAISKAETSLHRGDQSQNDNSPLITINSLTIKNVMSPNICVINDSESIDENGNVTVTITKGETASMALLYNYNKNVTFSIDSDSSATITDEHISNENANAEYVPLYDSITIHGIKEGRLGPFSVKIKNDNGEEKVRNFIINVIEADPEELPSLVPLTEATTPEPLFTIDFDDNDDFYSYLDEYGTTQAKEDTNAQELTKIDNTNNGLIYDYDSSNAEIRNALKQNSGISGNAFYSFLNTNKIVKPDVNDDSRNLAGNGYRGSKLMLDNEKIQRTDRIKVSYDFAFYNIVNNDDNFDVGMPVSISMTSEGLDSAGIPYDFNENHYYEIDADPSNPEVISKHLLTFFTGRPKRDTNTGVHWTDMTNTLAYFDPRYKTESNPYGQYRDLGIELDENAYNYFHVDAEIDFYNDIITFSIYKFNGTTSGESATKTIKTTIPKNSSWNGFILASNKWDEGTSTDRNGRDTEHYIYLDNITASKIAYDDQYVNPTDVPTAKPLPTDAVAFLNDNNSSAAKELNTSDTWAHYSSHNIIQDNYGADRYVTFDKEVDSDYNFTYNIMTPSEANGITSYTEFDFMLPKKGSYITVHLMGRSGNGQHQGNTITITDSGINSWSNLENYEPVYETDLSCGRWYSLQLVYDQGDSSIEVRLFDADGSLLSDRVVDARNLKIGYYRVLQINPPQIPTTSDDAGLPEREPSMAETYIANLRVYNRGVIAEYYPEGYTADENGNAIYNNQESNGDRLASRVIDFVHDSVGDENTDPLVSFGAMPTPPKNDEGKTFKGWKLIYSNGTDPVYPKVDITGGEEGKNATRLKYAAVYGDLDVTEKEHPEKDGYYYKEFSTTLPIIEGNNYKTIDWFVYNDNAFRMKGSFDLTGYNENFSGEGNYVIDYVVYNIPEDYEDVTAIPQAHHEKMSPEELAQTTDEPHGTPEPTMVPASPAPSGAPKPTQDSE